MAQGNQVCDVLGPKLQGKKLDRNPFEGCLRPGTEAQLPAGQNFRPVVSLWIYFSVPAASCLC